MITAKITVNGSAIEIQSENLQQIVEMVKMLTYQDGQLSHPYIPCAPYTGPEPFTITHSSPKISWFGVTGDNHHEKHH